MTLDLVVRNATLVDGSGGPRYRSDVGVKDGRITELGRIRSSAQRTIDADGLILAPGFIDGHTHMDAQVNWDPMGSSSCWHGVTSVVMGNCGHVLAPCQPKDREWYARCLSKVEDIPVESMKAGIEWTWESFPEYLENVDRLPKGINYGVCMGHSGLRMYVLGERAFEKGAATQEDLSRMRQLLQEALRAGALGFTTSLTEQHQTPNGTPVSSYFSDWREIEYLVDAMGELNAGNFELAPDVSTFETYRTLLKRLGQISINTRRPMVLGVLATPLIMPWQEHLQIMDETAAAGGLMYGLAPTQPFAGTFSLKSYLPFDVLPEWKAVRSLTIEEQQRRFGNPEVRKQLVAAEAKMRPRENVIQGGGNYATNPMRPDYSNLFVIRRVDTLDNPSIQSLAQSSGKHAVEVMLDLMREDADVLFLQPSANRTTEEIVTILKHPRCVATFSDSGAHVCQSFGATQHSLMLSYWVRERQAFTLEEAVRKMTFDVASVWELRNRGLIRRGYAADLVLFDEARVKPLMPKVETDLPGGARRLVQKAEGFAYTIVNGQVTLEDGKSTGNHSGQLLRGPLAH